MVDEGESSSAPASRGPGGPALPMEGQRMLELIVRMLGLRLPQDLVAANRMARITWIAIQQGRVRSALES